MHKRNVAGGVCVYIRDDFKATVINLAFDKIDGVEIIWVTVQCRKFQSIGCTYYIFQVYFRLF